MERKLNLFLIGFAKCGTTSFFNYLRHHKDIGFPTDSYTEMKEPSFFRDEKYEELIAKAGYDESKKYLADFTVSYIWEEPLLQRIHKHNPDAMILIFTRDKVKARDSFWRMKFKTNEFFDFSTILDYYEYDKWIKLTKKYFKNVLVLSIDDDTRKNYLKVLSFLGLEMDEEPDFKVWNKREDYRSVWFERLMKNKMVRKVGRMLIPSLWLRRKFDLYKKKRRGY